MVLVREDIPSKLISDETFNIDRNFGWTNSSQEKVFTKLFLQFKHKHPYRLSRNIKEKLRFKFCTIWEYNYNRGFQHRHKILLHEVDLWTLFIKLVI